MGAGCSAQGHLSKTICMDTPRIMRCATAGLRCNQVAAALRSESIVGIAE
jgi:hypothetical protein